MCPCAVAASGSASVSIASALFAGATSSIVISGLVSVGGLVSETASWLLLPEGVLELVTMSAERSQGGGELFQVVGHNDQVGDR